MSTAAAPALPAADVEFYEEHGWWVSPTPVLDESVITAARKAVEKLYTEGIPQDAPTAHKAHLNWRPGMSDTMRINNYAAFLAPELRTLATHPVVGALAAALARTPAVRLFNSSLVHKPASDPDAANIVGWHTDKAYWPTCTSRRMLTAWIPLHDVTADRSPLRVLDGSHRWSPDVVGDLQRVRGFTAPDRQLVERTIAARHVPYTPVTLTMPAGSLSFHHCLTFHGSAPNSSPLPRMSLTVHLQDDANRWQAALETDGSASRYQHDDKVRRTGEGDGVPDYTDPAFCPEVWRADRPRAGS